LLEVLMCPFIGDGLVQLWWRLNLVLTPAQNRANSAGWVLGLVAEDLGISQYAGYSWRGQEAIDQGDQL